MYPIYNKALTRIAVGCTFAIFIICGHSLQASGRSNLPAISLMAPTAPQATLTAPHTALTAPEAALSQEASSPSQVSPPLSQEATPESKDKAVVLLSTAQMREEPNYSAELGNQALMGRVVSILDRKGYWVRIETDDPYKAWVNEAAIAPMDSTQISDYQAADKCIFISDWGWVYASPSKGSAHISDIVLGDIILKGSHRNHRGWLSVTLPSGQEGWVPKGQLLDLQTWTLTRRSTAENICNAALRFVGIPYLWGGNSIKGLDCSGLTSHVFFLNGIHLPRNASQQAREGDAIDTSGVQDGDFSLLQPADLLFFGNVQSGRVSHVGIYLGGGRFIHSSQYVHISSLDKGAADYYDGTPRLLHIRRIVK